MPRLVTQSWQTLCDPRDCSLPGSSVDGILQAKILEWVAMPSSRGSSQTKDQTRTSLLSEPPGKPKDTGVGCHTLLQGIFPTQGSNPGLPQCRPILYHLSQQGSPRILEWVAYPFSRGSSPPRNQTGVS